MKNFKKQALALAALITMALSANAFAASEAEPTTAAVSEAEPQVTGVSEGAIEIACLFCCDNSCNGGNGGSVV